MTIDGKLLSRLEHLSAINIEEAKKGAIEAQLSEILSFVENLNALDLPEIQSEKEATFLREDSPQNSDVADFVLENAPNAAERFFLVPKIIE